MVRKILVYALAITLGASAGGSALAQNATSSGTTSTGIAKPPPGTAPPQPARIDHSHATTAPLGNNTPTLPQIALHPGATIGSGTPVAGPGGSSSSPTGY